VRAIRIDLIFSESVVLKGAAGEALATRIRLWPRFDRIVDLTRSSVPVWGG
jgi:hypothetical protein